MLWGPSPAGPITEVAMLAFPVGFKIYLAVEPVDMRKQFDGLWAVVQQQLKLDPLQGAVFAFSNRSRDRVKLLYWDGTGVWVCAKRLEKGRFTWPEPDVPGAVRHPLTPDQLTMLLAGVDLRQTRKKKWFI